MKYIVHIDLNAFFANAEILRDPSLKGLPLAIGRNGRSGIISTCTYEARKYGVKSGMPTFMALKVCPHLIIRKEDFAYYHALSKKFFDSIRKYTDKIEVASVDECFADMSDILNEVDAKRYLKRMQDNIQKELGLTFSIGVGPSKFLAKMGSDYQKPSGLTFIFKEDIPKLLYPLSIDSMYGIGKKSAPKLKAMGILTIGDLATRLNADDVILKNHLGKFYYTLKEWLNGEGDAEINNEPNDPKSIGHSITFMHDTNDENEIEDMFLKLSKEVSQRAKNEDKLGKTIQIVMKKTDFKVINKSITFNKPTNDERVIFNRAMQLFEKNYDGSLIRLVGVTLQNLISPRDMSVQMSLFDYQEHEKENEVRLLINELNRKMEKPILKRAGELLKEKEDKKNRGN